MLCKDLVDVLTEGVNCYSVLEGTIMIDSDDSSKKYLTSSFGGAEYYKVVNMLEQYSEQRLFATILRCSYTPRIPKDEFEMKKFENQKKLYGAPPSSAVDVVLTFTDADGLKVVDNLQ